MIKNLFLSFFLLSFFLHSSISSAQSVKQLSQELSDLKEVSLAQSQNLAKALNQVQEVVTQFQELHGQIGSQDYFIKKLQKTNEDILRRLEASETKVEMLIKQLEDIKQVGLLKNDQAAQYKEFMEIEKGLTFINAKDFNSAITHLEKFSSENPKSKYLDIAKYWLAESQFAIEDYAKAVVNFQKLIADHPKSSRVPASVLKQGLSFFNRQSFDESSAFLAKVMKDFPDSKEAIIAQATISEIKKMKAQRELEKLMNQSQELDQDSSDSEVN